VYSELHAVFSFFGKPLLIVSSLLFCLPDAEAKKITVGVKPGLQYDPKVLHVQPGEDVELTFDNVDEMMHNFVLVQPGARMEMVEAAIALASEGPELNYVPESDKVIASTLVVLPGKKATIRFKAPAKEGQYPYVCTFPGHGFLMHGILFVSKEVPKEMYLVQEEPKEKGSVWENFGNQGGAIVHRTFMPDSTPAGIAVSLPGGHSYCWDAGECRLRYAWRGGFIKKNGSFGRWRTLPTIEGLVYHLEESLPFREKGTDSSKGPATVRFEGYRMIDGIPEFRYRVGNLKVNEYLAKLPGKSGLIRRFKIEGATNGIVWEVDPDAGVSYSFNKGKLSGNACHLTNEESRKFQVKMEEIPSKFPVLRLGMNDLAVCYNRKGDLHSGAVGQSWLMKGGKPIIPAQQVGDYSKGSSLSFWVKLTDPSRPVSNIVSWENGGGVSYRPEADPFVFGATQPFARNLEGIFEAEDAKFKGPSRSNKTGGFMGSGYVDFGSKKGEYVEWDIMIRQDGLHTLRFRYASYDDRPLRLSVDSKEDLLSPPLPFASTRGWAAWRNQDHRLDLKRGMRRIRLTSISDRGPNIDRMEVAELKTGEKLPEIQPVAKPVMDDQWHLVCLSLDDKKASLYLDGAFLAENPLKGGVSPSGKVSLDGGSGNPRYYLDELRVYERPLSGGEIKRLLAEREAVGK
jgi:azurin